MGFEQEFRRASEMKQFRYKGQSDLSLRMTNSPGGNFPRASKRKARKLNDHECLGLKVHRIMGVADKCRGVKEITRRDVEKSEQSREDIFFDRRKALKLIVMVQVGRYYVCIDIIHDSTFSSEFLINAIGKGDCEVRSW